MTFSCYGVIDHTNEKSIYPCISHDVKYRHIIFPKLHAYNYILLWFWYELILYDCMWSTPDEYPWIHRMNHQGLISKSHYYVYKKCDYNGICDTRTRKRSTTQSYCMHMVWHWINKILTFARRILITNKITWRSWITLIVNDQWWYLISIYKTSNWQKHVIKTYTCTRCPYQCHWVQE